jgi:uncharacterized protein YhaN
MVIEIRSRLNKAIESQRKHKELETSLDGSVEAEKRARAALDVAIQCFDLFLGTFRVADVATLRAEVRRAAEISDREARIDAREKSLVALSGPGEAFEVLARSLGSVDDIVEVEARTQQLEASLSELGSERDGLHEKSGAAHDRARILERDDSATDARQHRSDVLAQLEASAERWSVLALATAVLATARAGYEEAHRPAVVGAAEEYFRAWTDGRYIRILAPIGGQIEGVEHRDGTRVELADLSRGTAEQLYLALRFGLVRHFAGGAESLPIVMDDILVNFDDERAALAARSIEDLARHQQILYFTCHPETPLHGTEVVLPRLRGVPSSA